ncbi:biotin--[acetyl-CoA-carboxylase] ligase [Candidatus Nitrososphaera sp. FF02]|uniref:biotin--[acetyl-CoA-carboxylase] ligase n=1 Tax=Candidatus Nitrososphaera sp. FF02 TaxID=3398226 RepID=UPI0039E8C926
MARASGEYKRLEEFLELLSRHEGYASGQFLAKKAGISRSAVWKQIRRLRQCGYAIESLHGMGYRLASSTTYPVPWELAKAMRTAIVGRGRMVYRDNADSTQTIAIALAEKHTDAAGAVVIAEQQSGGRGRMKRRWLSPRGGVWLSVVLKPGIPTATSTLLPFVAALAVCDAVRETTGLSAALKWPNDVMIKGKKVAGILLDLSAEAETVNYAVIGIGINANVDTSKIKIDREGRPEITSLKEELGKDIDRLRLTATLLEKLEQFYLVLEKGGPAKIVAEWRRRSDMLGKKVSVVQQGRAEEGVAQDINDDGSLLLKTASGTVSIVSGDIHVSY